MEKPKLFETRQSFLLVMGFLAVVLLLRLGLAYHTYQAFISKPFYYTYATVLTAYKKTKNSRAYTVLKVRCDEGWVLYTTTHHAKVVTNSRLRLQLFPDTKLSFQDYLGTFYIKSRMKAYYPSSSGLKEKLLQNIASQHEAKQLQSLYTALFFATPVEKSLREKISMLGVSHLVALSGFHLGILWGLSYGMVLLLYRPLQQHYFPYRHALFDVGLVAVLFLGFYLWFVDFPPSLLRAYAMTLIGWTVLLLGIELVSFMLLATLLALLLALFPSLLVSLAFWLSIAGVFYIFLILQQTEACSKRSISLLFIPWGIFVLMLPVVHTVFGVTTPFQLLSPLLSLLFVPFYPVVMVLHLLGWGGVLDGWLTGLFLLPDESREALLPLWMTAVYIALSLGAIWSRVLFYMLLAMALVYAGYLFC